MNNFLKQSAILMVFVFVALAVLWPNSMGNNPDVIVDESYFLTSSLQAIQKHTLPGWEFSYSGNYYGGPQTYVDFVALIPTLGVVLASQHFSVEATQAWVAQHTGDLLHVLRTVNGLLTLALAVFLYFYFARRRIQKPLALSLILLGLLIFSNSLFIGLVHTAKVWVFYMLAVALTSALLIAQEYYAASADEFLSKRTWLGVLVWSGIVIAFQNYVGAFSIALIALYALVLGHFSWGDVWGYIKKFWYWFVVFGALNISFIYRALFINLPEGSFAGIAITNDSGGSDLFLRLYLPLKYVILSAPLAVGLYVFGVFLFAWSMRSFTKRQRLWGALACVHPVVTYLFFHALAGFTVAPRYGIMLGFACALGAAVLVPLVARRALGGALVLTGALALVVGVHSIALYWQPSTEVVLERTLAGQYNSPKVAFITDPSALRLTLPTNTASLQLLDQKRADMSRFQFLLAHPQYAQSTFKPLVATAYTDDELKTLVARAALSTTHVWVISSDNASTQEPTFLATFLGTRQLGSTYTLTRAR
ncbi:MAG: hypothetical protein KGI70_01750 [Patescibacteria group bacterium]|nr:hypothetical protein [Patescibacteria group bacterium]